MIVLISLTGFFLIATVLTALILDDQRRSRPPSPLSHEAAILTDAVNNRKPEAIRGLTARGTNLNIVMCDGTTVLHAAAGMGRTECVRALLDGGADVVITDAKGRTPLHWVAECGMCAKEQTEITRLLLQAGSDPHAKNVRGETPLAVAVASGNSACAQILREHSSVPARPQD